MRTPWRTLERCRESRFRAKEKGCPPHKHGSVSGYQYFGCRCERCCAAGRAYQRAIYHRQKAALASVAPSTPQQESR